MPVSETIRPETAAITAATPRRSISGQLQKRLDREGRLAHETRRVERLQVRQALDEAESRLPYQSM